MCKTAAEYGKLDALKWLKAHGCPWDKHTCQYAAEHRHLSCLNGRERMGVHGMRLLVPLQLKVSISPS